MKNLKNKTTAFALFFILFFFLKLEAQPLLTIHQSSSSFASSAIAQKLGPQVQVSPTTINTFFNGLFSVQINPAAELVRAQIGFFNLPSISFGWSPIKGSTVYYLSTLNLVDGLANTIPTGNTSHSFQSLNPDLYLFAFYSDGPFGRSNVNIMIVDMGLGIIIDKDIFASEKSSDCPGMTSIPINTNTSFAYSKSFDWPNLCGDSTFYLVNITRTNSDGNTYSGEYEMMYEFDGNKPKIHIVKDPDSPNAPYFFGVADQFEILFTRDKFTVFYPDSDLIESTTIEANTCACSGGPVIGNPPDVKNYLELNSITVKGYPNPTQSFATINYQIPESGDVSVYITDVLLQNKILLQEPSHRDKGSHQLELDLQSFIPGVYYCIVQTKNKQKCIKIIKTD